MAGNDDELLPPHTVAGDIEEMVRLTEQLAVDVRVGAPPQRMVSSVVGLRHFAYRLLEHLECRMRTPNNHRQFPFGFQPPQPGDDPDDNQ